MHYTSRFLHENPGWVFHSRSTAWDWCLRRAAPDFSLPYAAAKIGTQMADLAAFLASPTEREMRIDAGNKGRMHIHHLIQDALGSPNPYVSHQSEGFGGGRVLVIRKLNVSGPEDLALRRQMQAKHADALGKL